MAIPQGTKLGHYEIRSQLGAGGMGEVYLADDLTLHRRVAIKVLRANVTSDEDRLKRFEIEAFAAYKRAVDPQGHFNRGKLLAGANLANAYTPSFALIGHESLILERSDIGAIANSVKGNRKA